MDQSKIDPRDWGPKEDQKELEEGPIHPAKTLDMIVGTSTGGIIAMSLLAGRTGPRDKKDRRRMNVHSCMQFYRR